MIRWLMLLVVLVMPLQFAWSAAAAYCEHESAPTASHLGHHAHQHEDASAAPSDGLAPSDAAASSVAVPHADCAYCHAGVAQLPQAAIELPGMACGQRRQRPPGEAYRSRIEPDIDRPKWTRAA